VIVTTGTVMTDKDMRTQQCKHNILF